MKSPSQKSKLALSSVVAVSVGAMFSGLFILPGLAYTIAGPALIAGFLIAAFFALIAVWSNAEITSAMPTSGSAYFYVTRSFGSAVGMTYGLITWLALTLKSAVGLLAVATFATLFFDIDARITAIILALLLSVANMIGLKHVGKIQTAVIVIVLFLLAVTVYRGVPHISITNFKGFLSSGPVGTFAVAGFVFVSYAGLLKIASVADEIASPGINIPKGMLISLAVITTVYTAVLFTLVGVVPPAELSGSPRPISLLADSVIGPPWGAIAGIIAIVAIIGATNAGIMAASRYPFAIAKDGMLPKKLGVSHPTFHTPAYAVLLTTVAIIVELFFDITAVIKAASAVLILTYMFSAATLIVLKESKIGSYRPQFKAPFYPWLYIIGLAGYSFMLYEIGSASLLITLLLLIGGFAVYWFFGRKKAQREFALLHLIERITAKELTSNTLERELLEIVHRRDGVLKDRFDHLVEQCPVIDLEQSISAEQFFVVAAEQLSSLTHIPAESLAQQLQEREKETSTVLLPFLAIPHIVTDGERQFHLLVARCRQGISFNAASSAVTAAFVMIGSRDERTFHLQALAAVAQISQTPDFQNRWLTAKTTEDLRNILLLDRWRISP